MRLYIQLILVVAFSVSVNAAAQDIKQTPTWTVAGEKIGSGWDAFSHIIGGDEGIIYAIDGNGALKFYKDKNRNGTASWSSGSIGSGWNIFKSIFGGPDGIIYAIETDGDLRFYKDNARDGSKSWTSKTGLGTGWDQFAHVFGGHDGVIYAIKSNGDLMFYKDKARDGTRDWAAAKKIGSGWGTFIHVFGGEAGIIYAVDSAGKLRVYKDKSRNGTANWDVQTDIGSGWNAFDKVWGGEGGVIYARKPDGDLFLYKISFGETSTITSTSQKLCVPSSQLCVLGTWTENGNQRTLTGNAELELPGGTRLPMDNTSLSATIGDGFAIVGSASLVLDLGGVLKANFASAELAIGSGKNLKALGMGSSLNVSDITSINVADGGFYVQVKYNQANKVSLGPLEVEGGTNTGNELIIDSAGPSVFLAGNIPPGLVSIFPNGVSDAKFLYLGGSKFDYTLAGLNNKQVTGNILLGGDIPMAPGSDAAVGFGDVVGTLWKGLPNVRVGGTLILDTDKDGDGRPLEAINDFTMAMVGDVTLDLPTLPLLEGNSITFSDASLYMGASQYEFAMNSHTVDGWNIYEWPFVKKQPSSSGSKTKIAGTVSKNTTDLTWTYNGNAQTFGLVANGAQSTTHVVNDTVTFDTSVTLAGVATRVSGSTSVDTADSIELKGDFVVGNYAFGTDSAKLTKAGGAVINGTVTWANRSWRFANTQVTAATNKIKSTAINKRGSVNAGAKVDYDVNAYFLIDNGTPKARASGTGTATLAGTSASVTFPEAKLGADGKATFSVTVLGVAVSFDVDFF